MSHILLISENRVLLKQLYTYLEGKYDLVIHVVLCSSNAFERFTESRADVVLLDTDVGIPYRIILQQLQQSQRNYHIILLSEFVEPEWDDPRVSFLNKASLTPDLLLSTLQTIAKDVPKEDIYGETLEISSDNFRFVSYPDAYYIMFIKYVGAGDVEMDERAVTNLKAAMVLVGECETVVIDPSDLLLLLRKSKMRVGFEFAKLPKIVIGTLGHDYAVIYAENINWRMLDPVCYRLESLSKYAYFLKQESIEISELPKRIRTLPLSELHEMLMSLLRFILLRETARVKDCLNEIFLHRLKESMDFYSLAYVRCNVQIISILISSIVNLDFDTDTESFPSIELEFDCYEQRLRSFAKDIAQKSSLNALIVEAMTDMYKRYREDISLAGIAQDLNVNKVYLSRLFREQIGITVLELLQIIRIQNAKFLLQYSDLRISAIAREVGYSDAGYFSRIFRKHTHSSPEDFRSYMKERRELL